MCVPIPSEHATALVFEYRLSKLLYVCTNTASSHYSMCVQIPSKHTAVCVFEYRLSTLQYQCSNNASSIYSRYVRIPPLHTEICVFEYHLCTLHQVCSNTASAPYIRCVRIPLHLTTIMCIRIPPFLTVFVLKQCLSRILVYKHTWKIKITLSKCKGTVSEILWQVPHGFYVQYFNILAD